MKQPRTIIHRKHDFMSLIASLPASCRLLFASCRLLR